MVSAQITRKQGSSSSAMSEDTANPLPSQPAVETQITTTIYRANGIMTEDGYIYTAEQLCDFSNAPDRPSTIKFCKIPFEQLYLLTMHEGATALGAATDDGELEGMRALIPNEGAFVLFQNTQQTRRTYACHALHGHIAPARLQIAFDAIDADPSSGFVRVVYVHPGPNDENYTRCLDVLVAAGIRPEHIVEIANLRPCMFSITNDGWLGF